MKKGRYLNERQRDAIAVRYKHDTLYQLLRSVTAEADEVSRETERALSAEDLFYLLADVMDRFIEIEDPHDPMVWNVAADAWLLTKQRLRSDSPMSEEELTTAASLVVITVRECLRRGDAWRYWEVCAALAEGTTGHDPQGWERLLPILNKLWLSEANVQRFAVWWQQYHVADEWLSDELEELLLDVQRNAPQTPEIEYQSELIEALRPFFWDDALRAEKFLLAIYHKSDMEVTAELVRLKRSKAIDLNRKGKVMYQLLAEPRYQLYRASYQNFAEQLKE